MYSKFTGWLALSVIAISLPIQAQDNIGDLLISLTDGERQHVLNNIHQEYVDCSAYFMLTTAALQKQNETELADNYQQAMMLSMSKATELGSLVDISDDATAARLEMAVESMSEDIDNNFNNMSILLNEHRETCREILDEPRLRVKNWIDELGYN